MRPSRQRSPESFLASSPASPSVEPLSQQETRPRCAYSIQEQGGGSTPDKIVLYSYFTSSFELIKKVIRSHHFNTTRTKHLLKQVLEHHGIQILSIHGNVPPTQRAKILQQFKQSGRDDPRVLLISNVGSEGLNVAFANILIIIVSAVRAYIVP